MILATARIWKDNIQEYAKMIVLVFVDVTERRIVMNVMPTDKELKSFLINHVTEILNE